MFLNLNTNLSVQMFYMHVFGHKTVYVKFSSDSSEGTVPIICFSDCLLFAAGKAGRTQLLE